MATTDHAELLQLAQMPIDRRQPHRVGSLLQETVQLLAAHFISKALQFLQQLDLLCRELRIACGHGWMHSSRLLAELYA